MLYRGNVVDGIDAGWSRGFLIGQSMFGLMALLGETLGLEPLPILVKPLAKPVERCDLRLC
jgi:hypothetical protein